MQWHAERMGQPASTQTQPPAMVVRVAQTAATDQHC